MTTQSFDFDKLKLNTLLKADMLTGLFTSLLKIITKLAYNLDM
mgnify:CR=1 FL=1